MKLVAGVNSREFALITADSRITSEFSDGLRTRVDCCQKVFRIGERTIVGFAGNIVAMAGLLHTFGRPDRISPAAVTVDLLGRILPPALSEGFDKISRALPIRLHLSLIIAGAVSSSGFEMLVIESPGFAPRSIAPGDMVAGGTGVPVIKEFATDLVCGIRDVIQAFGRAAPEFVGWTIGSVLQQFLVASGVDTVGRILHTIYIDTDGVWRAPYECQVTPHLRAGTRVGPDNRWVQYDSRDNEITLMNPQELVGDNVREILGFDRFL